MWDRLLTAVSAAFEGEIVMIDSTCMHVHQHGATGKKRRICPSRHGAFAIRATELDREIARRAKDEDVPARRMTIPGIGPITGAAIAALAPPIETFRKGRDFAA